MSIRVTKLASIVVFLSSLSVSVYSDDFGIQEMMGICDSCSYQLGSDTNYFGDPGFGYTKFESAFLFNSGGNAVKNIQLTFRLRNSAPQNFWLQDIFTGYDSLVTKSLIEDSTKLYNLEWFGVNSSVFNGDTIGIITFTIQDCRDPNDSLRIELETHLDSFWVNQFLTTDPTSYAPATQIDGAFFYYTPFAELTPLGPNISIGDIVDSAYVGEQVSIQLFLDTITFKTLGGYNFTLAHDAGLIYDSLVPTHYAQGNIDPAIIDTIRTDTTVQISIASMFGDANVPEGDTVFMTIHFTLDSNGTPSFNNKVRVKGNATFSGCTEFEYISNHDLEYVYIRARQDPAVCETCTYALDNDTVLWANEGSGYLASYHIFSIDSDGKPVEDVQLSMKVVSTGGATGFIINDIFTQYDSLTSSAISSADTTWRRFQWHGVVADSFNVTPICSIYVGAIDCSPSTDSLLISIEDHPTNTNHVNRFFSLGNENRPDNKNSGYRFYEDATIDLTFLGPGISHRDVVDSTHPGGNVSAKLYLDTLNFHYIEGYTFTLRHDIGLDFDSLTGTAYSENQWASPTDSVLDDSTVLITWPGESSFFPSIPAGEVEFMTAYFHVGDNGDYDEDYKLRVKDWAVFKACDLYADSSNNNGQWVIIRSLPDTAICDNCSFELDSDTVNWVHGGVGFVNSNHQFTADSYGKTVTSFQISVKVNVPNGFADITLNPIFTAYDSISNTYIYEGNTRWETYRWWGVNEDSLSNALICSLTVWAQDCRAKSDSLAVEIANHPTDTNYTNRIWSDGLGWKPAVLNDGYRHYNEPTVDLTVLGPGILQGDVVDSGYPGGDVSMKLYLDTVNFHFYEGYNLTLAYDSNLFFDSASGSDYATKPDTSSRTDTSIVLSRTIDYVIPAVDTGGVEFLTLYFHIDTAAPFFTDFQVRVKDWANFNACTEYKDSSNNNSQFVYLRNLTDTTLCDSCSYALDNDTVLWANQGSGYIASYHIFSIDSDGKPVDDVQLSMKVVSTGGATGFIVNDIFTQYDSLTSSAISSADTTWRSFHWHGVVADSFNATPISSIYVGAVDCSPSTDSLLISIEDHPTNSSFLNRFTSGPVTFRPGTLSGGFRFYDEPVVDLTLLGPGVSNQDVVDSNYVGAQVSAVLFLDTLNFHFVEGYSFQLEFHPSLQFDSAVGLDYSSTPSWDSVTDNSVRIYRDTDALTPVLDTGGIEFIRAHFTIETSASAGTNLILQVKDWSTFFGCELYGDSSDNSSQWVYLASVTETAIWRFDSVTVVGPQTSLPFNYYLTNNAPISTDVTGNDVHARFTFNKNQGSYSTYSGFGASFSYQGGYLYWDETVWKADTAFFEENHTQISTYIRPSNTPQAVGYLEYDVSSSPGTDDFYFHDIIDSSDANHDKDNFVVVKHTGDTLREGSGLTLSPGQIRVITLIQGCPTLYTWDGNSFVLNDAILTHSQGQLNPIPADDFYPLKYGVAENQGRYDIEIREDENEISYIDQVELIVVDYHNQSQVGISVDGHVYTYRESIQPTKVLDHSNIDLTYQVLNNSDFNYSSSEPGFLEIVYENPMFRNKDYGYVLSSGGPIKSSVVPDESDNNVYAEVENLAGEWINLGIIPPREFDGENSRWSFRSPEIEFGGTIRVRITWQTAFTADAFELHIEDETSFDEYHLAPIEAEHTSFGKVVPMLASTDDETITLRPGEKISLAFESLGQPTDVNYIRRFFLKSHGYYEVYSPNANIPTTYLLKANYPNPFNPATTIGFAIPVSEVVTLEVFNILGQKVKTLFDGKLEAGNHEFEWDGTNSSGSGAASGIYFYRLKAGNFERSKKMTLLK